MKIYREASWAFQPYNPDIFYQPLSDERDKSFTHKHYHNYNIANLRFCQDSKVNLLRNIKNIKKKEKPILNT